MNIPVYYASEIYDLVFIGGRMYFLRDEWDEYEDSEFINQVEEIV